MFFRFFFTITFVGFTGFFLVGLFLTAHHLTDGLVGPDFYYLLLKIQTVVFDHLKLFATFLPAAFYISLTKHQNSQRLLKSGLWIYFGCLVLYLYGAAAFYQPESDSVYWPMALGFWAMLGGAMLVGFAILLAVRKDWRAMLVPKRWGLLTGALLLFGIVFCDLGFVWHAGDKTAIGLGHTQILRGVSLLGFLLCFTLWLPGSRVLAVTIALTSLAVSFNAFLPYISRVFGFADIMQIGFTLPAMTIAVLGICIALFMDRNHSRVQSRLFFFYFWWAVIALTLVVGWLRISTDSTDLEITWFTASQKHTQAFFYLFAVLLFWDTVLRESNQANTNPKLASIFTCLGFTGIIVGMGLLGQAGLAGLNPEAYLMADVMAGFTSYLVLILIGGLVASYGFWLWWRPLLQALKENQ